MSNYIDWDWDKSFTENARILNSQEHERRLNEAARVMAKDLGCNIEDQLAKDAIRGLQHGNRPGYLLKPKKKPTALDAILTAADRPERKLLRWRACHLPMPILIGIITLGKNQKVQISCDLPEDAKVVRWFIDPAKDGITVLFEHPTFPEVEEGALFPLGPPVEFRFFPDGPSQASQARR